MRRPMRPRLCLHVLGRDAFWRARAEFLLSGGFALEGMQAAWKAVMEVTKAALAQHDPPLVWGTEVVTYIHEHGVGLPKVELANMLLQCLSAGASSAVTMWTYVHHAMSCQMVSVLHMLALLTSRVIPNRHQQPEMYTMYLELTSTFAFLSHLPRLCHVETASYLQAGDASLSKGDYTIALKQYSKFIGMHGLEMCRPWWTCIPLVLSYLRSCLEEKPSCEEP